MIEHPRHRDDHEARDRHERQRVAPTELPRREHRFEARARGREHRICPHALKGDEHGRVPGRAGAFDEPGVRRAVPEHTALGDPGGERADSAPIGDTHER